MESEDGQQENEQSILQVDDWLRMQVESQFVGTIQLLRGRLQDCLLAKVANPSKRLNAGQNHLLVALTEVLSEEWDGSGLDFSHKWSKPPDQR